MREQGDAHAPSDDELLTYFLAKTEGEWHWDDRAINRAFDAFSRVLYPDAVAPIADGVGAAAVVAPYRQDTVETARDPRRWILAGALGVAALIAAGLGLQALTNDHPRPPVPAASSPTPTVSPARPTPSPTPPETDNDNGPSLPPGELQVQTRLKGAEADKNGDFVRMTSYADRHEARAKGEDFSTVWWIAREQLDAVNGSATPTNRQIWEFTDQTLDHNDLTWDEARRLRAEQKIRLLSDAAAQKVISR